MKPANIPKAEIFMIALVPVAKNATDVVVDVIAIALVALLKV